MLGRLVISADRPTPAPVAHSILWRAFRDTGFPEFGGNIRRAARRKLRSLSEIGLGSYL